jgi:hypothetical protein
MAELRKRGLVTAVIYSGPFLKLGKAQARTFGVPELPLLEITHPLGGISLDEVKSRAEQAAPQFADLITKNLPK